MLNEIVKDAKYINMMQDSAREVLSYLIHKNCSFGILCRLEFTLFTPPLPSEIEQTLRDVTLFYLAGYTLESAYLQDRKIIFEAGFGSDNFGSIVEVEIGSIMQIIVEDTPIFINLSEYKKPQKIKEKDDNGVQNSISSFLSNPENEKFFKR
ncbi:MAG: hypothetical protein WCR69_07805 [Sulfuricurvum sp.]